MHLSSTCFRAEFCAFDGSPTKEGVGARTDPRNTSEDGHDAWGKRQRVITRVRVFPSRHARVSARA